MNPLDVGFEPPAECVQWCNARPFELQILDEGSRVDLRWWNDQLAHHHLGIRLRGRDNDGRLVDDQAATILRGDLCRDSELIDGDDRTLGLLYLCAAWRGGARSRHSARRFPDMTVRSGLAEGEFPLDRIRTVLDACVRTQVLPPNSTSQDRSGLPETPDVGLGLLAAFMWAVGVRFETGRAQMIDQNGLATLVHSGWLEVPAMAGFTRKRYERYNELVTGWAGSIDTAPELVESWLVHRWQARVDAARAGTHFAPSLF